MKPHMKKIAVTAANARRLLPFVEVVIRGFLRWRCGVPPAYATGCAYRE
jgi:hypothetical protein